ncbi:hypothetical protein Y032_0012g1893 [Ancylostoma ceylanicum]|uniref:C2H2-type domain-containing protein n=1 Tax=Ancylostoma ceylanicum TaxID=53326 RepID=A0A016VDD9_9BILA|nr:hypothetical protein Y032_0012g1893 [Ancylostoma ceylanicum]
MGLRISPLLAIVYLNRIERKSLISGILFYKRYVDDVFVISSNDEELHTMLENLNKCDSNVKFTTELPDKNGYLLFLNTKVRISKGRKQFRWHKKTHSKNALLHSRSAHPIYMKVNMVRNIIVTKERTCSEESEEVEDSVKQSLRENGYTTLEARSWRPYSVAGGIPLVLPFVNEQCARDVNRIVRSSGLPIKLIFRPPPNLKSLLASSRIYEEKCGRNSCTYCTERKICQQQGTVYMVTCEGCGEKYVGETARPLHKRIDEHLRALRNHASYPNSSFSHHRTLRHTREDPPGVRVTVLHRSLRSPLERKLLEALEIKRITPEINNRDELWDTLRLIT